MMEISKTLAYSKRCCVISCVASMILALSCLVMYYFGSVEIIRLQKFETKMKPYENYNMNVCGVINKYMEYLSGIDETSRQFGMYEKSINDLQKQNPKYDILAIDSFLKKKPIE